MVFAVCPLILSRVALFWIFHKVHWARFRLNEWTQNWSFSAPCLQGGPSAPSRQLTAQTDLHTHTCLCESCSRLQSGRTLNRASRHFSPSPLLSGPERESAELHAQHALRKPGKTSAPRGSPALWVSAGRKHDEHAAALKCGLFLTQAGAVRGADRSGVLKEILKGFIKQVYLKGLGGALDTASYLCG